MNTQPKIKLRPASITKWGFPEADSLYDAQVATAAAGDPKPRPDLNGTSIIAVSGKTVWLIDRGYRRGFTNERTFLSVFDGWKHVHEVLDETVIPEGPLIPQDFALIQSMISKTVYLLDGGRKRGIPSEEVFNRFSFSWKKIVRVDNRVIDAIPEGGILS